LLLAELLVVLRNFVPDGAVISKQGLRILVPGGPHAGRNVRGLKEDGVPQPIGQVEKFGLRGHLLKARGRLGSDPLSKAFAHEVLVEAEAGRLRGNAWKPERRGDACSL